jgi:hypothetical protein
MRFDCESKTYIDTRGHKVTDMHFVKIEEAGDREKEIEDLRERADFLSSHGHKGNKWERLLRAKEENI